MLHDVERGIADARLGVDHQPWLALSREHVAGVQTPGNQLLASLWPDVISTSAIDPHLSEQRRDDAKESLNFASAMSMTQPRFAAPLRTHAD